MQQQSMASLRIVSVTCRFDALELSRGEIAGFSAVKVGGCRTHAQPGSPQMPFRIVRLLLPPGTYVTGVEAVPMANPVVLDGNWRLDYGRHPLPLGRPASGSLVVSNAPNPAIYQSAKLTPDSRVELVSVQRMAGHDIAILHVFPLQYTPAAGRLIFSPVVQVKLTLKNQAKASNRIGPRTGKQACLRDRARVGAFVDNPAVLDEYPVPLSLDTSATTSFSGSLSTSSDPQPLGGVDENPFPFNYLLVTSQALLPAFQPLLDRRMAEGLAVHAETMENIATNFSGVDLAEKLRNYIRYAYTNSGVQYVLLGGDVSIVPTRYAYGYCSGYSDSIPSDLYFACLDGSWNGNGNGVWGESNDGDTGGDVDMLAEVIAGRAPVETQAEVENFVAKTLAAESNMASRIQACFAGEYLGYVGGAFAQGGDALDTLLPSINNSHSAVTWLDDRPSHDSVWTTANALSALNSSPLLAAHYGHADDSTVMWMGVSDVALLTNVWPFLFYSAGCDAGAFDNFFTLPDCVGEELVKYNQHAAFAAVLNTRLGWFDGQHEWLYSGEYQRCFFSGLLTGGQSLVGTAQQLAKQDMIGSVETSGNMPYRWCYFGLVLLGDPCVSIHVPLSLALRDRPNPSSFIIEWNSQSNATYSVFRTTDLLTSNVVCLASNIVAASPFNTYTDAVNSVDHAFYWVREKR